MSSQKYEPILNLALDSTKEEREQSNILDNGYNAIENTWEVIVRYSGDIEFLRQYGANIVYLEGYYAILNVPDSLARRLSEFRQIIYVEMPKSLYLSVMSGVNASCISPVISPNFQGGSLTGKNVICAVIDSGIDIFNNAFRNNDGTTRIIELWDQNISGNPPAGYNLGTVYNKEELDEILNNNMSGSFVVGNVLPGRDITGHGTHVAGIMAGNFAADKNNNVGIATQSPLIVVKMNTATNNGFPRTTEMMQAIDYVYKAAVRYGMPVSINISFGNSYGSHDGTSLLETYIDNISDLWKMSICIGTGNEGAAAGHSMEIFKENESKQIACSVGNYERSINIQIWKTYEDEFEFILVAPGGINQLKIDNVPGSRRSRLGNNTILIYYGEPSPYSRFQEIYIEIIPYPQEERYITSGRWIVFATAVKVVSGQIDMWLPDMAVLNEDTRFDNPEPDTTLTIPSTCQYAISVGGYNALSNSYADFSGRGFTRFTNQIKPDIVAPAVNISSAAVGGGMTVKSGTSMACPFVSGSAALLMEWGIVKGNDVYLYGQKLKAYLIRGAKQLPGEAAVSKKTGFGRLCLRDSIPR